MVKRRFISPDRILMFMILFIVVLVGCTVGETANEESVFFEFTQTQKAAILPTSTPAPTNQILPTRTLDLYRPDTVRATYAAKATQKAGQPTSTPRPSSTPTLNPQQLCQPFPDNITYLGKTQLLGTSDWTLRASCNRQATYLKSPVGEMTLFDYTSLTGRFAYGSPDTNQSGLWVYDYWTEFSEKWLNAKVIQAEWAAVKNSEDIQLMAILDDSGTLSISQKPFQIAPIATDVTYFSISPMGDLVAYIRRNVLYVIPIQGGQPRKLAEDAYGTPRWAVAENAIIFPSSPIKIAYLDGSGAFIPQGISSITERIETLCNGNHNCALSSEIEADHVLWDGHSHLLVFYKDRSNGEASFRTIYAYELSDDLKQIVNRQTVFGDFTNQIHWDIPGTSIIDSAGNEATLDPPSEIFTVFAKINLIEDNGLIVEFMWTNPWNTSRYGHQFTHVAINDQSLIIDVNEKLTTLETIKPGMTIQLTARKLSPYTLSLFAYKIQISCDQVPCYLGFEGRS
jgi:hypothetical protein